MSLVIDNTNNQILLKEILIKLDDISGEEYLNLFVNSITRFLKVSSCCIYRLSEVDDQWDCSPLYISSREFYGLINNEEPGNQIIKNIIKNKKISENIESSDIFSKDNLLVRHSAQSISGYLIKDINKVPFGFVLLIDHMNKQIYDGASFFIKQHINRMAAELERVLLKKSLEKTVIENNYLVETSRDLIWEIDADGFFINVSRSSKKIYGYDRYEMKGKHFTEFMSREEALDFSDYLKQSIQGNGIYDVVSNHINKSGKAIQLIFNVKPKFDYRGICTGFMGSSTDITESVRAQIAIKNNCELFSAILARLPVVFFSVDEKGILTDIRGQGLRRMGVDDLDWVGKPGYGLFVGMDERIDAALSGETVHFESSGTYEGSLWWFYTSMFFDSWSGYGAVGFAVDITDQKEIEVELIHLLKDNRELAQHLVEVQEEERRNLSRELHDELGQTITAVKSLATAITVKSGSGYSEVRSLGNSIIDLSGRLYDVVNSLMRRLRPDILDSLGFDATINSCIDNSQLEKTGVNCKCEIYGDVNDLDELVQITVYRIIQECLTNISKYAMASNVDVSIKREMSDSNMCKDMHPAIIEKYKNQSRDLLIISVEDDGIGMDTQNELKSTEKEQKMGLQGIKERVMAIGGNSVIESRKGKGVKIIAILDLSTRKEINLDKK